MSVNIKYLTRRINFGNNLKKITIYVIYTAQINNLKILILKEKYVNRKIIPIFTQYKANAQNIKLIDDIALEMILLYHRFVERASLFIRVIHLVFDIINVHLSRPQ